MPTISVVIATRNRPDDLRRCLDSLTSVCFPHWDVLVIDQSDDIHTREVAKEFAAQMPHLTYQRMGAKGQSRSRNAGLRESSGEIMAFLDDDCTVDPDWLQQVAMAFARHPEAAFVFGAFKSAPLDPNKYFVPTFEVTEEVAVQGLPAYFHEVGAGASMYLRRAAASQCGVFDIHLGPGARFPSSDDYDYYYRLIALGQCVVMTPSIVVWHYGGREYASGAASRLFHISYYSHGAGDMKLLRSGRLIALPLIGWQLWRHIRDIQVMKILLRRRPTGLARLVMYLRGLVDSFQLKVDRQQCLYLPLEEDIVRQDDTGHHALLVSNTTHVR